MMTSDEMVRRRRQIQRRIREVLAQRRVDADPPAAVLARRPVTDPQPRREG